MGFTCTTLSGFYPHKTISLSGFYPHKTISLSGFYPHKIISLSGFHPSRTCAVLYVCGETMLTCSSHPPASNTRCSKEAGYPG